MGPELSAEERKALIREGLLRWHPDKFAQRFAARLPEDRAPVLARVNALAQEINEALAG